MRIGVALVVGSLTLATVGCEANQASSEDESALAAVADDGSPDGGSVCAPLPPLDPLATTAYESDIVQRLAGATEVAEGVRLSDRASPANRRHAREYLVRLLDELHLEPIEHAYGSGTNVYAELPSTSGSEEWVVLGAHFDSVPRSPGANDNATGVALVYAVARSLMALPCRSKNVMFVLFDQEEIGLVGSREFANKLVSDGRDVRFVHTVDQMGWDKNGDRLIELERPTPALEEIYRAEVSELGLSIPIVVTSTNTTDHASFRPWYPAVGVTEGYRSGDTTPDYHRPSDTADKVDFAYLHSSTDLVARVLARHLR